MLRKIVVAALALSCLTAGPAFAHVGQGHVAGFAHGFAHPLSGLDHIIAMVAVGLYAAESGWPQSLAGAVSLYHHHDLRRNSRL